MSPSRLNQPLTRPRRGATLVFVALLLTVIIGISAVAIDLSRLYVGVNELQTAVDAGALRGALALQRGGNPVNAATTFLTTTNSVMGSYVRADDVWVNAWRYEMNGTRTATTFNGTGPAQANAVEVVATQPSNLLFGRTAGLRSLTPTRSATAWVMGMPLTCVRPFILDFDSVFVAVTGESSPSNPSEKDFGKLYTASPVRLAIAPPTVSANPTFHNGGRWVGVGLDGPGSSTPYGTQLKNCNSNPPVLNASLPNATSLPSVGGNADVVDIFRTNAWKIGQGQGQGAQDICGNADPIDDRCDVTNSIMLGRAVGSAIFANEDVRHVPLLLTTFRVLCIKRPIQRITGGGPPRDVQTQCASHTNPTSWLSQPVGTIYGYLELDKLPVFTGNSQLGVGGTTAKRLVLVR